MEPRAGEPQESPRGDWTPCMGPPVARLPTVERRAKLPLPAQGRPPDPRLAFQRERDRTFHLMFEERVYGGELQRPDGAPVGAGLICCALAHRILACRSLRRGAALQRDERTV